MESRPALRGRTRIAATLTLLLILVALAVSCGGGDITSGGGGGETPTVADGVPSSNLAGGDYDSAGLAYADDPDWLDVTCGDLRRGGPTAHERAAQYAVDNDLAGVAPSRPENSVRQAMVKALRAECRAARPGVPPMQPAMEAVALELSR